MKELVESWYESGIIRVISEADSQGWILKSGAWSPIYINFRILGKDPAVFKKTVSELTKLIGRNIDDALIMGIPTMGAYLATAIAYENSRPLQAVQMTKKAYGITADLIKAPTIVLIDDVVTSGQTVKSYLDELFQLRGMSGIYTYALVDRRKNPYQYKSITTLDAIYKTINGDLTDKQRTIIEWYLENRRV